MKLLVLPPLLVPNPRLGYTVLQASLLKGGRRRRGLNGRCRLLDSDRRGGCRRTRRLNVLGLRENSFRTGVPPAARAQPFAAVPTRREAVPSASSAAFTALQARCQARPSHLPGLGYGPTAGSSHTFAGRAVSKSGARALSHSDAIMPQPGTSRPSAVTPTSRATRCHATPRSPAPADALGSSTPPCHGGARGQGTPALAVSRVRPFRRNQSQIYLH